MNVTLGILAHVDAGKTTLSEAVLYRCGALRNLGRVDYGDACLDFDPDERQRGITIYSAVAEFTQGDNRYFLVDTPGHADFLPELERCLSVLDYALLVISATDGIQAGTVRLWRLLQQRNIPVLLFLNKLDHPGADRAACLAQLRAQLSPEVCDLIGGLDTALEQIAMTDETALEAYLSEGLTERTAWDAAAAAVKVRRLFPVFGGSALRGDGVAELLDGLDHLCRTDYDASGPVAARVYQIRRDKQGNRACFCKVLSGTLRPRMVVGEEKISELRRYQGEKWSPLLEAPAGAVAAVTGLREVQAGTGIGVAAEAETTVKPLLLSRVEHDGSVPPTKVLEALRQLEDEEPTLSVRHLAALGEIQVAVMGEIQLEILREAMARRFGLAVTFGPCRVLYQETVAKPVRGCGHFEPLRHYAEVHLLLEPGPRGSGIAFESRCPTDDFAAVWQKQVRTHVLEKQHVGALTGSGLTDVNVVLLAGAAHEKHTEGGDFREATYRAIRQALFMAENVLLEPYYRFTAEAEPAEIGKMIADMARLRGQCQPPESVGTRTVVSGRCPVAAMLPYCRDFAAMTRGRGVLYLEFDGYEPCTDQDAVVARLGYDRERDTENTADSVFCSHGAGYPVKWFHASDAMHLRVD